MDYAAIPGWDKVDNLAEALLELRGLSVTSSQADNITHLYNNLSDFDKAPLTYEARQRKAARGRFARSKGNHSAHIGEEAVKRYTSLWLKHVPLCETLKKQVLLVWGVSCSLSIKESCC